MQLNRRGHEVTVYERHDRIGGLLRYGIPNMKLEKSVLDRRIHLMEEEGVKFVTGVDVGKDIKAEELTKNFDRVILDCGASNPRDIKVPGRDAEKYFLCCGFSLQSDEEPSGFRRKRAGFPKRYEACRKASMCLSSEEATPEMTVWEPASVWEQNP